MTKSFPLQSILDLSQMRLDEATRRLGELISGEQKASQRLEVLMQYREEYHGRFLDAARNGLGHQEWNNYRGFLDRLDEAIAQARDVLDQSQQLTAAGQQDWLSHRGRVKAFDTLAQRHQKKENYAQIRQEQKDLDEHAARGHSTEDDG